MKSYRNSFLDCSSAEFTKIIQTKKNEWIWLCRKNKCEKWRRFKNRDASWNVDNALS
jgi:hypothetical protein